MATSVVLCRAGTPRSSATTQVLFAPISELPVLSRLPSWSSMICTVTVPLGYSEVPHTLVPGESRCRTMPCWKIPV